MKASPEYSRDTSRVDARRLCEWCGGPIRRAARRDAKTCSQRCRQAKARFRVSPAGETAHRPMLFAYADPPYPGLARKYYDDEEVDHRELVARLVRDYPDGWALSTSAKALRDVLLLCPADVRVCAWVKGPRPGIAYRARSAWEPVIVWRGRARHLGVGEDLSDTLLWGGRQRTHPGALVGMKPAAFCEWVFRLLGAQAGDELDDLFPGSGAVGRAWRLYSRRSSRNDIAGGRDTSRDPRGDGSPGVAADVRRDVSRRARDDTSRRYPDDGSEVSCLAGAERRLRDL